MISASVQRLNHREIHFDLYKLCIKPNQVRSFGDPVCPGASESEVKVGETSSCSSLFITRDRVAGQPITLIINYFLVSCQGGHKHTQTVRGLLPCAAWPAFSVGPCDGDDAGRHQFQSHFPPLNPSKCYTWTFKFQHRGAIRGELIQVDNLALFPSSK